MSNYKRKYLCLKPFRLSTVLDENKLLLRAIILFYSYQYSDDIALDIVRGAQIECYHYCINESTRVCDLRQTAICKSQHEIEMPLLFISFNEEPDLSFLKGSRYQIGLMFEITETLVSVKLAYKSDMFSESSMKGFLLNFDYLCSIQLLNESLVTQINALSPVEENKIKAFCKSKNLVKDPLPLIEMLEKVTTVNSNRLVLSDGELHITWKRFDILTDYYAKRLLELQDSVKHQNIGIYFKDEVKAAIAIFSVVKAGLCFVPLNIYNPFQRTNYMLKDADISILLHDDSIDATSNKLDCSLFIKIEMLESLSETTNKPHLIDRNLDNPAYIIYTSGTTGNPKGIIISQRSLSIIISWFSKYFLLNTEIKSLHILSYTFDFGLYDVLSTVLCGGILYCIDKQRIRSYRDYCNIVNKYQINNICITPSLCNILSSNGIPMPSVKILHFGGEQLTYKMVRNYKEIFSDQCEIYNGYGPSECTIGNTIYKITDIYDDERSVPIGYPNGNSVVLILNKAKKLSPIGGLGEICIAGDGLGLGYVGSVGELKTSCDIFDISFIYKSGDLAYWNDDNSIQFVKRHQQDIKINGYRVDILEIEKAILTYPGVKQCCVALDKSKEISHLIAFIIGPVVIDNKGINMKKYLRDYLPAYMIPVKFIVIDAFPITINGKINKQKLIEQYNSKDKFRKGNHYEYNR